MKSPEFCYWLQGFFELGCPDGMTPQQVEMVRKHLSLVFIHELDKTHGTDAVKLNAVHNLTEERPRC